MQRDSESLFSRTLPNTKIYRVGWAIDYTRYICSTQNVDVL